MIMEKKTMTNTGTNEVQNLTVEHTSVIDLLEKKISFNAYIKKDGKQIGILMHKTGEQFYHTYNNPEDTTSEQKIAVLQFLLDKIAENQTEMTQLTSE